MSNSILDERREWLRHACAQLKSEREDLGFVTLQDSLGQDTAAIVFDLNIPGAPMPVTLIASIPQSYLLRLEAPSIQPMDDESDAAFQFMNTINSRLHLGHVFLKYGALGYVGYEFISEGETEIGPFLDFLISEARNVVKPTSIHPSHWRESKRLPRTPHGIGRVCARPQIRATPP